VKHSRTWIFIKACHLWIFYQPCN